MKFWSLFLWCTLWLPANSQVIQSVLLDQNTHQPVVGASIFFNGTSFYELSDEQGHFAIPIKQQINTALIITHVSYNMQSYSAPYTNIPDTIFLQEK